MHRHTLHAFLLAAIALAATGSIRLVSEAGAAESAAPVQPLGDPTLLQRPGLPEGSREVPALRKRNARTYLTPKGDYVAELFPGSINYRDEQGAWQPIENELVPSSSPGSALRNKGNRYTLELPANLASAPVKISEGERWLSFQLAGARGAPVTSGASARYPEALPGVELSYRAENDRVKEELILASKQTPASFSWTLKTSPGLDVRRGKGRALEILTQAGEEAFTLEAPYMEDAAGVRSHGLSLSVARLAGAFALTLSADRDWLQSDSRRYPVVVDPGIGLIGAGRDCTLASGVEAATNLCSYGHDRVAAAQGAVSGEANLAAGFDGQDDHASVPNAPSLNPSSQLTLEAWVKPSSVSDFQQFKPLLVKGFTSHSPPHYQYGLFMYDTVTFPRHAQISLALAGVRIYLEIYAGWQYGTWNHLAATYDGAALRMYLNGNLVGSRAASGAISSYPTPLTFGAFENLPKIPSYSYKGLLDEAAVYPRALSQAELRSHYERARGLTSGSYSALVGSHGPVGYWRLGEGSGTAMSDASGNGNSGTYRNGVSLAAQRERMLLRFELAGVLPPEARVVGGTMWLHQKEAAANTGSLAIHELTRDWTQGATWNTADGQASWTSAGGDFVSSASYTGTGIGGAAGWEYLYPSRLVKSWIEGGAPNRGMLLKALNESSPLELTFSSSRAADPNLWPRLYVNYFLPAERPYQTYTGEALSDRTSYSVNIAAGNLIVKERDVSLAGTGLDLELVRTYRSLSPQTRAHFGPHWRLEGGGDVWLQQNADGAYYALVSPSGVWMFERNPDGSFTKPAGLNASLASNPGGGYTLTWDQSGVKWNLTGPYNYLASIVDRNGNAITYSYGPPTPSGYRVPTHVTDTQGRQTSFSYLTPDTEIVNRITDPAGRVHAYSYGAGNLLESHTRPDGRQTSYGYDAAQNLIRLTDARGNQTTFAYDVERRVTQITRVTEPTSGTGPTTRFAYDRPNRKTTVTDPNGNQTQYFWDTELRVTRTVDPLGHSFQTAYTANSDVDFATNATGHVTDYGYDGLNRLTSTRLPTGATTSHAYADPANPYLPTRTTDAQGKSVTLSYDPRGNLLTSTNELPSQNQERWTYNANGTLATHTDARGHLTSYGYFPNGNLQSVTPPAPLGQRSYTYDSLSRIATETDGKGQTTTYGYDALDRLISTVGPGLAVPVTYGYDANGNHTGIGDPHGGATYGYDTLNRLASEVVPNNPGGTTYSYDPAGNLLTKSAMGRTTTYGYSPRNQTTSVTEPDNPANIIRFSYDANGNRRQTIYPNGVTQYEDYDDSERLSRIYAQKAGSPNLLTDFGYGYRDAGGIDRMRVQTMTDLPTRLGQSQLRTTSYGYDAVSELTIATTRVAGEVTNWWEYGYDGNGNRTHQTHNSLTTTYTYDAANVLDYSLQGGQRTEYDSDSNGNRTREQRPGQAATTYQYNSLDQTTQITPAGEGSVAMTYSGAGQSERVSSGAATFVNESGAVGAQTIGGTSTFFTRSPEGQQLELDRATGSDHYYLTSGDGSVVGTVDPSGSIVNAYDYDPFGDELYEEEPVDNSFEYLGGYEDGATDFLLIEGGFYDPQNASFSQVTPDSHAPTRCFYAASFTTVFDTIFAAITTVCIPPARVVYHKLCIERRLGTFRWGDRACDNSPTSHPAEILFKPFSPFGVISSMQRPCPVKFGQYRLTFRATITPTNGPPRTYGGASPRGREGEALRCSPR